jgi:uncharacterized protein YbjT (DUF2867 family)
VILITGATGNIGSELVKKLSANHHHLRAFVRSRWQSREIAHKGVELTEGDFTDPDTFTRALRDVDRLFLLIPSSAEVERQQKNFVDAAKQSGVKHIVKLSQLGADENAPGRFQRYHGAVEKYILESGVPYTFLRPNLFMQGLLNFGDMISALGTFYAPAGDDKVKVSVVDVRDIASVAARVLTESGHEGETYDITGPEALSHAEMASQLSHAVGRAIKYVEVSPEGMRHAMLGSEMPKWQVDGLVEDYAHYCRGEGAVVTSTVYDVTGVNPINFFQFARDYSGKFMGKAAVRA